MKLMLTLLSRLNILTPYAGKLCGANDGIISIAGVVGRCCQRSIYLTIFYQVCRYPRWRWRQAAKVSLASTRLHEEAAVARREQLLWIKTSNLQNNLYVYLL